MPRRLLRDCEDQVVADILDGGHDAYLSEIAAAATHRMKTVARTSFPLGSRVRLVGTRNAAMEGKLGQVVKFNPKRVLVFLDSDHHEYMGPLDRLTLRERQDYASVGVPISMLERVE
jgi:hypothetical protein